MDKIPVQKEKEDKERNANILDLPSVIIQHIKILSSLSSFH